MVKTVFKTTSKNPKPNFTLTVPTDEMIFREGELGLEMYIIQEGEVEILKGSEDDLHRIALLGQGDFFGEMSILEDLPRTASARAVADCTLVKINGSTFDQMLRKNAEIAVRMMRKLSRRLRETDRLLQEAMGVDESQAPEMPSEVVATMLTGPERLIHDETGIELHLARGEETLIGRRDPVTGINPDIDLTPVDSQRSISRKHAKILRQDGKFFVREEIGSMNGTFVRGERVQTGVPVEFADGDELRFGLVKTIFHA